MGTHHSKRPLVATGLLRSLVVARLPPSGRSPRFELPATVLEPLVRGREDVIAEERRLLYVAMTRARKRLYLTRAEHYEGGRRWRESRFLAEVRASGAVLERDIASASLPTLTLPAGGEVNKNAGELVLSYSAIQAYR